MSQKMRVPLGVLLALVLLAGGVWLLQRPRWVYKRARHGLLVGIHGALVLARRIGITPALERACERLTGSPRPWRNTT